MSEKHWNPKRQYEIETGKEAINSDVIDDREYRMFNIDYVKWLQKEYVRSNENE